MSKTKLALECPYCHGVFEAVPPDKIRVAYSFDKPLKSSFYGEVIEQDVVCRNPKCRKEFKIYWYAPLTYFDRV